MRLRSSFIESKLLLDIRYAPHPSADSDLKGHEVGTRSAAPGVCTARLPIIGSGRTGCGFVC